MLGLLYSFGYFSSFFISKSGKFAELDLNRWIAKFVDISYIFYDLIFYKKIYDAFADAHNIHAVFTYEVLDLLLHFFWTMLIGTVIMHIFLCKAFMTRRTFFGWMNNFFFSCSTISNDAYDIRDYFSTSL